jgi:hypothetical protein
VQSAGVTASTTTRKVERNNIIKTTIHNFIEILVIFHVFPQNMYNNTQCEKHDHSLSFFICSLQRYTRLQKSDLLSLDIIYLYMCVLGISTVKKKSLTRRRHSVLEQEKSMDDIAHDKKNTRNIWPSDELGWEWVNKKWTFLFFLFFGCIMFVLAKMSGIN